MGYFWPSEHLLHGPATLQGLLVPDRRGSHRDMELQRVLPCSALPVLVNFELEQVALGLHDRLRLRALLLAARFAECPERVIGRAVEGDEHVSVLLDAPGVAEIGND